jgi:hypothetical protein
MWLESSESGSSSSAPDVRARRRDVRREERADPREERLEVVVCWAESGPGRGGGRARVPRGGGEFAEEVKEGRDAVRFWK